MTAAYMECFISGQYSSLGCIFNLCLTLSKQFIVDKFTPADKGPVLEDWAFRAISPKDFGSTSHSG